MKQNNVIIFEGPAGSGKTFAIKHSTAEFNDRLYLGPVLPEIERPRAYEGDLGYLHSQLKDYRSTLHMVQAAQAERVSVIDRWFLSQIVYDHIRRNEMAISPETIDTLMIVSLMSIARARLELQARTRVRAEHEQYNLLFVVLCPPPSLIRELRSHAEAKGRVYPYSAEVESLLYRDAAARLSHWAESISPIDIGRTRFTVQVTPFYSHTLTVRSTRIEHAIQRFLEGTHEHVPA